MSDIRIEQVSKSPLLHKVYSGTLWNGTLRDVVEEDLQAGATGYLVLLNFQHGYMEYLHYVGGVPFVELRAALHLLYPECSGVTLGKFSCTRVDPRTFPLFDCSRAYRLYLDGSIVGYFQNGRCLQHLVDLARA